MTLESTLRHCDWASCCRGTLFSVGTSRKVSKTCINKSSRRTKCCAFLALTFIASITFSSPTEALALSSSVSRCRCSHAASPLTTAAAPSCRSISSKMCTVTTHALTISSYRKQHNRDRHTLSSCRLSTSNKLPPLYNQLHDDNEDNGQHEKQQQQQQQQQSSMDDSNQSTNSISAGSSSSSSKFSTTTTTKETTATKTSTATDETTIAVASYKSIMIFVTTTVLIWLSEPLLSLVDTTVVGKFTSTVTATATAATSSIKCMPSEGVIQLAALGPATMLFDSAIYLTYFLAIAAHNKLATALAKTDTSDMIQSTSYVLGVAAVLGAMVTAIIASGGEPLLHWIVGAEGATVNGMDMTAQVISHAMKYVQIRGITAPFAVMGFVAQSVCLACLDTRTPFVAVIAASVLNVIGDVLLVVKFGMGITGAAIATAAATVVSTAILLKEMKNKMGQWRRILKEEEMERKKQDATAMNVNGVNGDLGHPVDWSSVKVNGENGALETAPSTQNETIDRTKQQMKKRKRKKKNDRVPLISFPDRKSLMALVKLSGPIFFVIMGKLICYSAMTLRATDFGMLSLACHNVMLRVFFFYATFGDSLSQAAQSFLPKVLYVNGSTPTESETETKTNTMVAEKKESDLSINGEEEQRQRQDDDNHAKQTKQANAVKVLLARLLVLSTYVAVSNSQIAKWILHNCGSYFTNDPTIISLMAQHSKYMSLALFLHPFIMLAEGAIIATSDLSYLVWNYAVTMTLLLGQLNYACGTFAGVWRALFTFQFIRTIQFTTRVWRKIVKGDKKKTLL